MEQIKVVASKKEGEESNLMFTLLESVRAYGTHGEIVGVVREVRALFANYQFIEKHGISKWTKKIERKKEFYMLRLVSIAILTELASVLLS